MKSGGVRVGYTSLPYMRWYIGINDNYKVINGYTHHIAILSRYLTAFMLLYPHFDCPHVDNYINLLEMKIFHLIISLQSRIILVQIHLIKDILKVCIFYSRNYLF